MPQDKNLLKKQGLTYPDYDPSPYVLDPPGARDYKGILPDFNVDPTLAGPIEGGFGNYNPEGRKVLREQIANLLSQGKTNDPSRMPQYGDIDLPANRPMLDTRNLFKKYPVGRRDINLPREYKK